MDVESWPIDRPKPYPKNPRTISQAAIDKTANSIHEFGWRQPIVVDAEGVIIAGHTRHLAAQALDLAEVPVHVAEGLSAAQVRAYRLADNRAGTESSWDIDVLTSELIDLSDLDFDMSLTAFDPLELSALVSGGFMYDNTGEHDDADLWPVVRIVVPPATFRLYGEVIATFPGTDEHQKFTAMLTSAAAGAPALIEVDDPAPEKSARPGRGQGE